MSLMIFTKDYILVLKLNTLSLLFMPFSGYKELFYIMNYLCFSFLLFSFSLVTLLFGLLLLTLPCFLILDADSLCSESKEESICSDESSLSESSPLSPYSDLLEGVKFTS